MSKTKTKIKKRALPRRLRLKRATTKTHMKQDAAKAIKTSNNGDGWLSIGRTGVKTKTLKFAPSHRKGVTSYAKFYTQVNELGVGDSFTVPVPKGVTARAVVNRLTAAINNGIRLGHIKVVKGADYRRRTLEGAKEVSVDCVKA